MAYSATNWVDGTTPVNATNLNKLEGGVADVASQLDSLVSQNLVPSNSSNLNIQCGQIPFSGGSATFTCSSFGFIFMCGMSTQNAVYFWRSGTYVPIAEVGSAYEVAVDGTTFTVSNVGTSTAARYIAFVN